MDASSSKRIKLDPSPSPPELNEQNTKDVNDLEQDHCTICLQPFLDRTIIPVCAHEFCFECILLWSEQSRKCPLCSRSFDDAYLIHRIRSQYDYQKHYLLPRSSPPPPLTSESRANALRNTRRERQWGRRQRQQREEADQLERAIARRRWIYQHHLYAKHVASNPYTRYRPFPTPAQFAASPDLVSRMTTFLRRELRVWPNLDVEFLTTYTISLMKSIDIRSESAVKLLSEFLDLDTPYTAGARQVHAEHFAHEIYSYLRSPYRDLTMYDHTAQYDTPPEIPPPQEIERGSRWSAERSPSRRSRSRSNSRYQSPVPRRENSTSRSPTARHGRNSTAEARCEDGPNHGQRSNRSPRGREHHDSRNHSSGRRHSPRDGVQDLLRNRHAGEVSYSEASSPAVLAEHQDDSFPVQPHIGDDEKKKSLATEDIPAGIDTPRLSAPQGDNSAAFLAANETGVTCLNGEPFEEAGNQVADYVDNVRGTCFVNPQPSRKRSAGLSVHVHPRNRTLSESVQAYLSRPAAPWHPPKKPPVSGDEQPTRTSDGTMDTRPRLLLRLTDDRTGPALGKLPSPCKTTVERTTDGDPSTRDGGASKHPPHGRLSQSQSGDGRPGLEFPPGPLVTPLTRNANVALSRASVLEGPLVDGHPESAQAQSGVDDSDALDVCPGLLGGRTSLRGAPASESDQAHEREHGGTHVDASPPAGSSILIGGERAERVDLAAVGDDASGDAVLASGSGSGSSSGSVSVSTPECTETASTADVDASALEKRLRARAHVRARLVALKGAGGSVSSSGSGSGRQEVR